VKRLKTTETWHHHAADFSLATRCSQTWKATTTRRRREQRRNPSRRVLCRPTTRVSRPIAKPTTRKLTVHPKPSRNPQTTLAESRSAICRLPARPAPHQEGAARPATSGTIANTSSLPGPQRYPRPWPRGGVQNISKEAAPLRPLPLPPSSVRPSRASRSSDPSAPHGR
jgi:hypothetical protein